MLLADLSNARARGVFFTVISTVRPFFAAKLRNSARRTAEAE
jgi:hypothetical protein